ncbi:hotdog fold thioesterase [Veronia pacifica]|uniref:Esterase n=1 Tax=Veronia pacifica TaxID=1080227 RepID=A0A1C3EG35_9GAMM|nr:hotdog fold thioesterase [Veronia pacifica]ODA32222.1 esterase [Veronia pacifica]
MAIWKKEISLKSLNESSVNTIVEHIGIRFTDFDDNSISGTMPVDHRTHQPLGILHGGSSVVLAETLGSVAANKAADEGYYCVGLDINANHVRAIRSGLVIGCAKPAHIGATTQVWMIEISDERGRLICTSRLTMAVLKDKREKIGR